MSDIKNLVVNGDMSLGTSHWHASNLSVSDGVLTCSGDLTNDILIPMAPGNTYRLTFDLKVNAACSNYWYITYRPYDSEKTSIAVSRVQKSMSNTETTLASAINNGDTTVTLTSGSNWYSDSTSYRKQIGICDNLAWGYNRSSKNAYYSSISGNVLTLSSAWTQGTIAAGTKVANFTDGGTYCYPKVISQSALPTDWTTYTVDWVGGDNVRYSTAYVMFGTLGYSHNYSLRNIKIENITTLQYADYSSMTTLNLLNTGVINTIPKENCRRIRYIKDCINGSTANAYNHWCEIQAFDCIGNNIAFNKNSKLGESGTYSKTYVTDGNTATSTYIEGTSPCIIDLGFVTDISKIKVWHYWGDGRTYYEHKVYTSPDGTTWNLAYSGQRAETSSGLEINLSSEKVYMTDSGVIQANDFIEY